MNDQQALDQLKAKEIELMNEIETPRKLFRHELRPGKKAARARLERRLKACRELIAEVKAEIRKNQ